MSPGDILLAILATGIWSGAFVATDTALREAPPILFAALRFCVSALALPFLTLLPRPLSFSTSTATTTSKSR